MLYPIKCYKCIDPNSTYITSSYYKHLNIQTPQASLYQSQAPAKNSASSTKFFLSSSSKVFTSAESISITATVYHRQHLPHSPDHHPTHLPIFHDRHHNLTLTFRVASDMSRKLLYILNKLHLLLSSSNSTNTPPELDGLACYLPHEWAEDELLRGGRVEDVEA